MLSDADKRTLLDLAKQSVAAAAGDNEAPRLESPSPALAQHGAAFVTLRLKGKLRGCIGHVKAVDPLWESVREMAASAATRDSRFSPVRSDEVADLEIELSVLSPMSPIRPDKIEVGTHGLYVRKEGRAGLLLPQVPVEMGWDRSEFLRRTFEKADLPAAIDESAEILAFTVSHFS